MTDRIVIVGNGMASVRLVEGLVARGLGEQVTVVGEEPRPAYNRILLSAVLEGTHRPGALSLRPPEWYAERGVDLRLGTRVVDVHRDRAVVELADRAELPYDRVVLATGAIPSLPPIRGLVQVDGRLHPKVHPFRSRADCDRLLAALPHARSAVIVGGGLLGLQVARALAVRGLRTEIVEGGGHLLRSQVDELAGDILKRSLTRLGTQVYTGARAVRLTEEGLRLDTGFVLDTDLVVLTAGGRPSVNLARRAGLTVRRGVVVDDRLASVDDPRVHAIGDCAGHPGAASGLVQPGWEQAAVLAGRLTGTDPRARYRGSTVVTRLKAAGIELTCLGDGLSEGTDYEILRFEDPSRERYAKLVIDGDRIAGAIIVGLPDAAAGITQLYDRGAPAPADRLALLLGRALPPETGEPGPGGLPEHAIVCRCNMVTKAALRDAWYRGATCAKDLSAATRAATGCGTCGDEVGAFATWLAETDPSPDQKEPALS